MRGVGRVLPRDISLSTWAVAAGVAVLCVTLALGIADAVRVAEPGARPLPRTSHLPLQPSQHSNAEKKAAREAAHTEARLTPEPALPLALKPQTPAPTRPAPSMPETGAGYELVPETGCASWYDLPTKTASGETMDGDALTAAHNTLPLGTRVRVANLDNGRAVVVRINDRGPFAKDRIIDLSKAAAKALGMIADGVADVRVTPVEAVAAANAKARE